MEKTFTVYYTNGNNVCETSVDSETVEKAIEAVQLELSEQFTVVVEKTKEQAILDHYFWEEN